MSVDYIKSGSQALQCLVYMLLACFWAEFTFNPILWPMLAKSLGLFSLQARGYLMSLPFKPTVPWSKLYSSADAKGTVFVIFLYVICFGMVVLLFPFSFCRRCLSWDDRVVNKREDFLKLFWLHCVPQLYTEILHCYKWCGACWF